MAIFRIIQTCSEVWNLFYEVEAENRKEAILKIALEDVEPYKKSCEESVVTEYFDLDAEEVISYKGDS